MVYCCMFGFGFGIEILCRKIHVKFEEKGPIIFSEWVEKLREMYTLKLSKIKSFRKAEVKV